MTETNSTKKLSKLSEIAFKMPTDEEIFARYIKSDENPNQFSNWFPKLKCCTYHFAFPRSTFLKLEQDTLFALLKDEPVQPKLIEKLNNLLDKARENTGLHYPIFVKNGLFSGKFEFQNCVIHNKNEFFPKLKNIFYLGMMIGVDYSREIVLRELIELPTEMSIYENMPLHTELRTFVNINEKKVLGIIDYWHESIVKHLPLEQQETFAKFKEQNASKFKQVKEKLQPLLQEGLERHDFGFIMPDEQSEWSVDFLWDNVNQRFILIDMALANQSWGYNLIVDNDK